MQLKWFGLARQEKQVFTGYNSMRKNAFAVLEALIVIVVAFFLFLALVPCLFKSRSKAVQIDCVNNLKQVALSFRMWGGDNGDVYPMAFKTNDFNGPTYANSRQMFIYFQVMSNELNTPKVLVCPSDKRRSAAVNFASDFDASKVSYFVGLDSDETRPQSLLAGDRNLTNGLAPRNGVLEITANNPIGWTKDIHQFSGDVALGDGSVQKLTLTAVRSLITQNGLATNRLVFPPQ